MIFLRKTLTKRKGENKLIRFGLYGWGQDGVRTLRGWTAFLRNNEESVLWKGSLGSKLKL